LARHYVTQVFNPAIAEKKAGGDQIAKMMGEAINQAASQGWTFQSYETVQITVNPGCLTFMSGPRIANYGVLVFYQDV
jgi:hypothetical protein